MYYKVLIIIIVSVIMIVIVTRNWIINIIVIVILAVHYLTCTMFLIKNATVRMTMYSIKRVLSGETVLV